MADEAGAPPQDAGAQGQPAATRRTVLRGVLFGGATAPFLWACGGSDNSKGESDDSSTSGGSGKSDFPLATSDVPSGGGVILADDKVVVTQPSAGSFRGFSAVCTHQACTLHDVTGGTINCICHGSKFSIKDGSVAQGPATSPLPKKQLKVSGGEVNLA